MKDTLLHAVSHDLKAPVGAVSGLAHLLRTGEAAHLSDDISGFGQARLEALRAFELFFVLTLRFRLANENCGGGVLGH